MGKTQLLITPTSFRCISIGDEIASHADYIQKERLRDGEGEFEIYLIKDFNNNPAGYFLADSADKKRVGDIIVQNPTAATAEGIKVGSTFNDVTSAYPKNQVHGSEIEGRTYVRHGSLAFRLDTAIFTYEVDAKSIPNDTLVTEVMITR